MKKGSREADTLIVILSDILLRKLRRDCPYIGAISHLDTLKGNEFLDNQDKWANGAV
ncbi:MAG: hypothetical protein RR858_02720 [Mucinivorans sp.]